MPFWPTTATLAAPPMLLGLSHSGPTGAPLAALVSAPVTQPAWLHAAEAASLPTRPHLRHAQPAAPTRVSGHTQSGPSGPPHADTPRVRARPCPALAQVAAGPPSCSNPSALAALKTASGHTPSGRATLPPAVTFSAPATPCLARPRAVAPAQHPSSLNRPRCAVLPLAPGLTLSGPPGTPSAARTSLAPAR